jgi:hypothetical protein
MEGDFCFSREGAREGGTVTRLWERRMGGLPEHPSSISSICNAMVPAGGL